MDKHLLEKLREDFWVIVLDIIAVNAAYLLTFFLRYYVHAQFVPAARQFVSYYLRFSPFYTVICLAVFALLGLYNGMWRYANVNSMNRIIAANGIAVILLMIGTTVFTRRMPMSIYAIGASFQLLFTAAIRYAYRIIDMERRKLGNRKGGQRNVMIVGTDVNAANTIRFLSGDGLYRPVVVVGSDRNGKYVRGLPVIQNMENAITQYEINCIIVADPMLSDRKREALRRVCEREKIELHDYSGFLKNQSGALPLTDLNRVISGEVRIQYGDQVFDSFEQAMEALSGRYHVVEITGDNLTIEIEENTAAAPDYTEGGKKENGEDVSFF